MKTKSPRGLLFAITVALFGALSARASDEPKSIVFVCEHGSVKSVMATLFFNRLAAEENIRHRALPRGLTPDEKIPDAVAEALRKEGFDVSEIVPRRLTKEESTTANTVIGFCNVPAELADASKTLLWLDVPPVSVDYEKARAAMLPLVNKLVTELKAQRSVEISNPGAS